MKRVGYLFEKIIDDDNISLAIDEAGKDKKNNRFVLAIKGKRFFYINKIKEMLVNDKFKNWIVDKYQVIDKGSGKIRDVLLTSYYPDQVIHHAVMQVIIPILSRGMISICCANIPKRGNLYARDYVFSYLKQDFRGTKYCLKMDIKKFYPSISILRLKKKLRTIIKDNKVLSIIDEILALTSGGLPLGTYCSQWFANFYLQDLDHFCKEQLHLKYYVRYADDIVILHSNRRKLMKIKSSIDEFLVKESLVIKPNWRIFKVDEEHFIDFVGYKIYRNKITIRKRIWRSVRRTMIRISNSKSISPRYARRFMSYWGYIKNSDSTLINQKYIKNLDIHKLRKLCSK